MLRCRLNGEDDFSGAHYRRGWLSGHEARAPRTWRWTTTPLTRVAGAPVANSATLREVELRCNDTPADHVEQELEYFDGAFIKRRRGRTGGQCHDEVPEGCLEGPDVTAQHGVAPVAAKGTQPGASAAMSDTGARGERKLREGWCTILCRGEELALSMGEQLEAGPAGVVSGAALPRNGRSTTRPICQTASGAQGPAAKAAAQNEPLAAAAAHAVWVCVIPIVTTPRSRPLRTIYCSVASVTSLCGSAKCRRRPERSGKTQLCVTKQSRHPHPPPQSTHTRSCWRTRGGKLRTGMQYSLPCELQGRNAALCPRNRRE